MLWAWVRPCSNVADNWLHGFPPTNFASNQLYQINIRSNYFTGGTAYKTTSGQPICPKKVNSYIISSSAVRHALPASPAVGRMKLFLCTSSVLCNSTVLYPRLLQ